MTRESIDELFKDGVDETVAMLQTPDLLVTTKDGVGGIGIFRSTASGTAMENLLRTFDTFTVARSALFVDATTQEASFNT